MHNFVHEVVRGLKTAYVLSDSKRGLAVIRRLTRAHLTTHDAVCALQRSI